MYRPITRSGAKISYCPNKWSIVSRLLPQIWQSLLISVPIFLKFSLIGMLPLINFQVNKLILGTISNCKYDFEGFYGEIWSLFVQVTVFTENLAS